MNTQVTAAIYKLVQQARADFANSKNACSKKVEACEEVLNKKYRSNVEELAAMAALKQVRVVASHVYILL